MDNKSKTNDKAVTGAAKSKLKSLKYIEVDFDDPANDYACYNYTFEYLNDEGVKKVSEAITGKMKFRMVKAKNEFGDEIDLTFFDEKFYEHVNSDERYWEIANIIADVSGGNEMRGIDEDSLQNLSDKKLIKIADLF